ncbi:MAG: toll/interleukin-1 receptor domain-containing protein [Pseudomonadota bacterium]
MVDVFISYKREERPKAKAIAEALVAYGFTVWWDIELMPGDRFALEIEQVIAEAKSVVVLWSEASVKSPYVRAEAHDANGRNIIIPVLLEDVQQPLFMRTVQACDLIEWDGRQGSAMLEPLLRSVSRITGKALKEPAEISSSDVDHGLRAYQAEADFWQAVSTAEPQSADEYRAYLARFGSDAQFKELAESRIKRLEAGEAIRREPPKLPPAPADPEPHDPSNGETAGTVAGPMSRAANAYLDHMQNNINTLRTFTKPAKELTTQQRQKRWVWALIIGFIVLIVATEPIWLGW